MTCEEGSLFQGTDEGMGKFPRLSGLQSVVVCLCLRGEISHKVRQTCTRLMLVHSIELY